MNSDKSTSSLKYPLLLGGMTAAAGLGYLYYRSMMSKNNNDFELSREQVKTILKEFRKDFYPIFKYLTNLSLTIQNDYKKKFNYIPDNIRNNLSVMLVYAMEDKIYNKFGIDNRSGFEAFVLKLSKVDSDVQSLVNEIKNEFRKALMGVTVSENINLPDVVNPDLILQVYKDSLKLVLQKILSFVVDYKERHGEINAYDENFAMQLKDLNLEQTKLQILEEKGLGNFEDHHPEKIFYHALTKYSKEDQAFKDRLVKMEVFHQTLMQKLFVPNADVRGLQVELEGIDKLIEVEEFVIKEIKDEWEDVKEEKDQNNENQDMDIIVTEKTEDHTVITHIHNNEIVEQIEEINIHSEPKIDEDGFINKSEDKYVEVEVVADKNEQDQEVVVIHHEEEHKEEEHKEEEHKEEEQKEESHNNQPEVVHNHSSHDFIKADEPVIEEVNNDDFVIEDTELKPVVKEEPTGNHNHTVQTPKLEMDE